MSAFRYYAVRKWAPSLAAVALCCSGHELPRRAPLIDDFGDSIPAGSRPARIVSLSPATTEIIFALGAGARVVGRTHWDMHPDSARGVPDLGNGIRPNVEAVLATHPDLVVLYASDDNRDAARALRAAGIRVVSLRMDRVAHFSRATSILGAVVVEEERARQLADSVAHTLARVRAATKALPHPTVFLPAWQQPLMAIGGASFLSELVEIAGGRNVFADVDAPSPQISFEELLRRDPDVVMCSPVTAASIRVDGQWQVLRAVRDGHVLETDTNLVTLPGVRLGEAAVFLAGLLHPGVVR